MPEIGDKPEFVNGDSESNVKSTNNAVLKALPSWVNSLLDMSKRNQLLYLKDSGKVDLSRASQSEVKRLLSGQKVRLSMLFPNFEERHSVVKTVKKLREKIREFDEDRGVRVGRAVSCLVTLPVSGQSELDTPVRAPLFLRYLNVTQPNAGSDDYELVLESDVSINELLLELLKRQHSKVLSVEVIDQLEEEAEADFFPAKKAIETFMNECSSLQGMEVNNELLLGYFQYQKLPMVEDLTTHVEIFADSDLVQAVAGDGQAMQRIRTEVGEVFRTDPNRVPPENEFLVLDADPSQNFAINAALAGRNIVIQGPPGTGKSQTISNLIAACMAQGKRVMFVAEKRAAIDAVLSRLDAVGLSAGIFDLHDGAANKSRVVSEIAGAISAARDTPATSLAALHQTYIGSREVLLQHSMALHSAQLPWEISAYDAQLMALGLGQERRPSQTLPKGLLQTLTPSTRSQYSDLLRTAADLGLFLPVEARGPWAGARALTPADVESNFDNAKEIVTVCMPELETFGVKTLVESGFRQPQSINQWDKIVSALLRTNKICEAWIDEVWIRDLSVLMSILSPRALRKSQGLKVTWNMRRSAKRELRLLSKGPLPKDTYADLKEIDSVKSLWCELSGAEISPKEVQGAQQLQITLQKYTQRLTDLGKILERADLFELRLDELHVLLNRLASDPSAAGRVAAANQALADLHCAGMQAVVAAISEVLDDLNPQDQAPEALRIFDYLIGSAIVDVLALNDSHFRTFNGAAHHRALAQFQDLDRQHRDSTPARIRRILAERLTETRNLHGDQDRYLDVELRRKRRIKPLRELLASAEDIIMAAKPCWAMSPLVVSQSLPANLKFDIVVFDEASQIRPADAITALGRARKAVVCGDSKQLPPTTVGMESQLFSDDEEQLDELIQNDGTEFSDFGDLASEAESLLDVFEAALGSTLASQYRLLWHYRSRDARLIDFSNNYFYDNSLMTFPGTSLMTPVALDDVEQRIGKQAQTDDEVVEVVDAIISHAQYQPEKSLGVIALGIKHANRIQAAFHNELRNQDSAVQSFFAETAKEPFFIKNLERVQGDERDYIILTPGYVKDSTGRLPLRFGTLNNKGGERRINVAVSRAKEHIRVISSFTHRDLDPERVNAEGAKVLGSYMKYAASGGNDLDEGGLTSAPLNPFEIHMRDRLVAAGVPVIAQYGVGSYRLDFVAQHPERPGQMVLAIEADGAAYHSSETARARDRLRQEHLERLGWKFCRVWSTDYFRNPDKEIERVKQAYLNAVELSDSRDSLDPLEVKSAPLLSLQEVHPRRSPRPNVRSGQPIDAYSDSQLDSLVNWISSDGLLRSDDDIVNELVNELGFSRRGSKIIARLQAAASRGRGQ